MTKEDLVKFEVLSNSVSPSLAVYAPVHLYYGNEEQIIKVFESVRSQDWVFCSWRSHYQCLLKGVPPKEIKEEIIAGRSISLCFPDYQIYSSALVGGSLPVAVGTAIAIKRKDEDSKVYCFMGDMTSETGIAHECIKYSRNHQLPIHFIIEDNSKSVCTDTRETWNVSSLSYEEKHDSNITYYHYETKYPHAGAGTRVQF